MSSSAENIIPPTVSLEEFRQRIPEGEFFAGKEWRWSPIPYRLSPSLAKELDSMGHRLLQFSEACELLYRLSVDGRQPAWIAELLDRGKSPAIVAIGRDPAFRGAIARVIRPDLVVRRGLRSASWIRYPVASV